MNAIRSRAAKKRGVNWKADCSVCGKPIANRMKFDTVAKVYAHASCSKKKTPVGKWEDCW